MAVQDLVALYPAWFMIVASFIIALLISIIYKYTSNQLEVKRIRDEMKSLQAKVKENKDDKEKMAEIQKEIAGKSLEQMKHSFKPMLYTFLPVILIFYWLRGLYEEMGVILILPFVGWGLNWIWTYILFSFVFSLLLRRILKIQ